MDALKYCQKHKGLEIYAWVLMTNHLHLIASNGNESITLSDILRDFKKFTSKRIVKAVQEEPESRKKWLLYRFEFHAKYNSKIKDFKFWQDGNDAKEIFSSTFFDQKLNYIHENPVRAEIVEYPEEYLYSSARNYTEKEGLLEIILI